jgi:DnaJ homolog subfamily B member 11
MGKSAIFLKAAAISSSISSTTSTVAANAAATNSISHNVNISASISPIEFQSSNNVRSCCDPKQNTICDTTTIERIIPLRGGGNSADDAASDASRKQHRRTNKDDTSKSPSSKQSKASPKPNKNTKSSSWIVNEIMKETDYYKILGLVREDLQQQDKKVDAIIQKAYRKRALQTHPDKTGGDRKAFDKVAEAYEVLQDENKRNIYNKYGKRGLEGGMGSSMGGAGGMHGVAPEDLFRSFFGGPRASAGPFGSFGQQQTRSNNRTMRFQVDVTLEDIYVGKMMKVVLPGSQTPIDLSIPRGSYHNENIIASGVIENDSNQPPGDAHFRIKVRPHATFTNKGYDLAIQIEISLAEALTGVSRTIRHLDGRKIRVVSAAVSTGSSSNKDISAVGPIVIATGDVHILPGEGMPKNAMGTEFGDLYIQYQVNMPKNRGLNTKDHTSTLTKAERNELERLLNKLEGKSVGDKAKVHWPFQSYKDGKIMKKASVSDFGKNGPRMTSDSDDASSPFGPFGDSSGFTPMGGHNGFFWSSTGSSSSGRTTHTNPFGQHVPSDEDAAQCRQM